MKVAVCFKIVPDFENLLQEEWCNPEALDFAYIKKMYGCFDESALEMALRIKDSCKAAGKDMQAVAVTCGAPEGTVSEGLLRALFAAGFDDVVLMAKTDDFAPKQTAGVLAAYFKENPVDLILTGRMTGPGDSGTVPFYLAEELKLPLFTELVEAKYGAESGGIEMTRRQADWETKCLVPSGAVATVGDAEAAYLRLFPLMARMNAKKRSYITWEQEPNVTGDERPELQCEEVSAATCRFIETESAEESAHIILAMMRGDDK